MLLAEQETLKKSLDDQVTEAMKLKRRILALEEEKRLLLDNQDRLNKNLHDMQNVSSHFKETLDALLVKVFSLQEVIKKLEEEKYRAECERDDLKIRAAVGFEELTPRPNFKKLMEDHALDFNLFKNPSKKSGISLSPSLINYIPYSSSTSELRNPEKSYSTKGIFEGLLTRYVELVKKYEAAQQSRSRDFSKHRSPLAMRLASKKIAGLLGKTHKIRIQKI